MSERTDRFLDNLDTRLTRMIELSGAITPEEADALCYGLLRRVLEAALAKLLLPAQIDAITVSLAEQVAVLQREIGKDSATQ